MITQTELYRNSIADRIKKRLPKITEKELQLLVDVSIKEIQLVYKPKNTNL